MLQYVTEEVLWFVYECVVFKVSGLGLRVDGLGYEYWCGYRCLDKSHVQYVCIYICM